MTRPIHANLWLALVLPLAAVGPRCQAQVHVQIQGCAGAPGTQVRVTVRLRAAPSLGPGRFALRAQGRPGNGGTGDVGLSLAQSLGPLASGCLVAARGVDHSGQFRDTPAPSLLVGWCPSGAASLGAVDSEVLSLSVTLPPGAQGGDVFDLSVAQDASGLPACCAPDVSDAGGNPLPVSSEGGEIRVVAWDSAPRLSLGEARAWPGGFVNVPVSLSARGRQILFMGLQVAVEAPPGVPPLRFIAAMAPPDGSWVLGAAGESGVSALPAPGGEPGALIAWLRFQADAGAPRGTAYRIGPASLQIEDAEGGQWQSPDLVDAGRVVLSGCAPGDVDLDGQVAMPDVVALLRLYVLGEPPPNECALEAADVTGDGLLTLADAVLVLRRHLLGVPLPSELL
ncbi:MAG TPA: dockerin type I repeat-containing protein [Armatimonadota bacterium]